MVNIRAPFKFFALLTFILTLSAVAQAQATRTWVSGVSDDVNPCSRTAAPCKTYAGAISKTAAHGENGNNRFAGNGGVSTVTAVGVMSNDFGQQ